MRLLIHENLSFRLAESMVDCFPDSRHVRNVGLHGGTDGNIWQCAKAEGMCILTKDVDFQSRSLLEGAPPKVILVRLGNCTTSRVEIALRSCLAAIEAFERDVEAAMLIIP